MKLEESFYVANWFLTKMRRQLRGERTQQIMLEWRDIRIQENKLQPKPSRLTGYWTRGLNAQCKNHRTYRRKHKRESLWPGIRQGVLKVTSKRNPLKKSLWIGLGQNKNFCSVNDAVRRIKKLPTLGKKYLQIINPTKDLNPQCIKNPQ